MLIEKYRNGSIGFILGKRAFSVPDTYYLGLSMTPINVDGSGITEPPSSSNYARVVIPNNINSWNEPVDGVVTNKIRFDFPELTVDVGQAVWFFLAETTSGTALWADELSSPRPLAQLTQVYINPGDAQFAISNSTTIPAIP